MTSFKQLLKRNWKSIIIESVVGFISWSMLLTPYVIIVTRMTLEQYISWLAMEALLVTPFSPIVIRLTNYVLYKFYYKKRR